MITDRLSGVVVRLMLLGGERFAANGGKENVRSSGVEIGCFDKQACAMN